MAKIRKMAKKSAELVGFLSEWRTTAELMEHTNRTRSSIYCTMIRMEEAGYVKRRSTGISTGGIPMNEYIRTPKALDKHPVGAPAPTTECRHPWEALGADQRINMNAR